MRSLDSLRTRGTFQSSELHDGQHFGSFGWIVFHECPHRKHTQERGSIVLDGAVGPFHFQQWHLGQAVGMGIFGCQECPQCTQWYVFICQPLRGPYYTRTVSQAFSLPICQQHADGPSSANS